MATPRIFPSAIKRNYQKINSGLKFTLADG